MNPARMQRVLSMPGAGSLSLYLTHTNQPSATASPIASKSILWCEPTRTRCMKPPPSTAPRETYDEPCGVKCWYWRLRAGYCGRGCDYYRFRMTQFREGPLGPHRVHVACR